MTRKNYSKFSERFKKTVGEETINEIKEQIDNEVEKEQVSEPIVENYIKTATVIGCEKLNLREKPSKDAKVLCVLNKGDKVQVDTAANTTSDFYQVCTVAGVKGYCVTKFIAIE